jgi:hypothetical protein
MIKLVYKPVSLLVSLQGGALAGAISKADLEARRTRRRCAQGHRRPARLA